MTWRPGDPKPRKRVRRTAYFRSCGPFQVESLANGDLTIRPDWPGVLAWNPDSGKGGPGLLERQALAALIEKYINGGKTYQEARWESYW